MTLIAAIAISLVALQHVWILVLEMYFWDKPLGMKMFGHSPEAARASRVLAANQGLYNGFLAAGLFWSLWLGDAGRNEATFFLLCVIVAGLYGGFSAKMKILWIQGVPAAVALLLLLLG